MQSFTEEIAMQHTGKGIYGQYDHTLMPDALVAVRGGLSIRKAAKQFQIPRSTLIYRVTGKRPETLQFGRQRVIPLEVEKQMAEKAMSLASHGFGTGRKQLITRASTLCKQLEIQTPFKTGIPGRDWWCAFKRLHPTVVLRKTEKLSTVRSRMLYSLTVGNSLAVSKDGLDDGHVILGLVQGSILETMWRCSSSGFNIRFPPFPRDIKPFGRIMRT